jgi:hypothetical protein
MGALAPLFRWFGSLGLALWRGGGALLAADRRLVLVVPRVCVMSPAGPDPESGAVNPLTDGAVTRVPVEYRLTALRPPGPS